MGGFGGKCAMNGHVAWPVPVTPQEVMTVCNSCTAVRRHGEAWPDLTDDPPETGTSQTKEPNPKKCMGVCLRIGQRHGIVARMRCQNSGPLALCCRNRTPLRWSRRRITL